MSETRTCENCGQVFEPGQWWCENDAKHVVPLKDYFLAGGGRTLITNIPPFQYPAGWTPGADDEGLGGVVEFLDGRFTTSDPEQQYWLDLRGGFCTEEEWQAERMSPEQLRVARLQDLERRVKEREREVKRLRAAAR